MNTIGKIRFGNIRTVGALYFARNCTISVTQLISKWNKAFGHTGRLPFVRSVVLNVRQQRSCHRDRSVHLPCKYLYELSAVQASACELVHVAVASIIRLLRSHQSTNSS